MASLTRVTVFVLLSLIAVFRSCNQKVIDVTQPGAIRDFYLKNGWIPLPIPDSRFEPGTIVRITKTEGISYISNLSTCGVPDDVLKPVDGSSPQLQFKSNGDYGAKAVLGVKGVKIGPEWSKVSSTSLVHESHGATSLDLLRVQIWMAKPENSSKIPQVCTDFLNAPDNYIVREAYRVSKGKYVLHGENGGKLSVSNLALGPVTISPDAHAKLTTDGELDFSDPVFSAIKRLKEANGVFQVLGQPGQADTDADAKVKQVLDMSPKQ